MSSPIHSLSPKENPQLKSDITPIKQDDHFNFIGRRSVTAISIEVNEKLENKINVLSQKNNFLEFIQNHPPEQVSIQDLIYILKFIKSIDLETQQLCDISPETYLEDPNKFKEDFLDKKIGVLQDKTFYMAPGGSEKEYEQINNILEEQNFKLHILDSFQTNIFINFYTTSIQKQQLHQQNSQEENNKTSKHSSSHLFDKQSLNQSSPNQPVEQESPDKDKVLFIRNFNLYLKLSEAIEDIARTEEDKKLEKINELINIIKELVKHDILNMDIKAEDTQKQLINHSYIHIDSFKNQ